jgi:hypothetical protein
LRGGEEIISTHKFLFAVYKTTMSSELLKGPKGGIYRLDAKGRKIYQKRKKAPEDGEGFFDFFKPSTLLDVGSTVAGLIPGVSAAAPYLNGASQVASKLGFGIDHPKHGAMVHVLHEKYGEGFDFLSLLKKIKPSDVLNAAAAVASVVPGVGKAEPWLAGASTVAKKLGYGVGEKKPRKSRAKKQ